MIPDYYHTPQFSHPISQATPLVLPFMPHAPQAPPTGVPHTLQPTLTTPQVVVSIPLATSQSPQAGYPYNNNWELAQQYFFPQYATQITGGVGEPSTTGPPVPPEIQQFWQCRWVTNGTCLHTAIDFDELMLHLGRVHDVQGSASRRIECRWPTERGICSMNYRRDGFRRHIGTHLGLSVPCAHCGKSFSREDSLRAHVKKCHDSRAAGLTSSMVAAV